MVKGVVFTIDALAAVVVAAGFFSAIAVLINQQSPAEAQSQPLNLGSDLLATLQKDGTLKMYLDKGEGEVQNDMGDQLELLPQQYCANFTVYKYKSSGTNFTLEKTFNTNTDCGLPQEKVSVKRMFVNFKKQRLGLAELDLWVR